MPFLTKEDISGVIQKIAIDQNEVVIGRHPDCQIIVEEGAISRRHARIYSQQGQHLIEDLQSRNGTYVNNRLIHQPIRLFDGDLIGICDSRFTFHLDEVSGISRPRPTVEKPRTNHGDSVLFDDQADDVSSIMSKMELSSHYGGTDLSFVVTPEKRLETIVNVTRALAKAVGLEQVFPAVLDCLFDLFVQVDRGFVVMREPNGQLTPHAIRLRNPKDDELIRVSRTIVNYVLDRKQAVISSDVGSDDRFDMSQSIAEFRIRSLMCAPLVDSDGNALGVIQLDTLRRTQGFNEQDLEVLSVVAMQASLAIENERLHQSAEAQRDLRRDLELAHEVQHGFLPQNRPQISGYSFYDYYRPAQQIGGDYYDYIVLNDGRIAVLVADVVGHGVAAALLMAKLSAEVRFALAVEPDAAQAVRRLNAAIEGLDLDRFVTLALAMIDPRNDTATIINAGHTKPLIRRADGSLIEPGTEFSSLPVGIMPDVTYRPFELRLESGDCVLMYTDGVNECFNREEEQFGLERLRQIFKSVRADSIGEICGNIVRDIKRFIGSAEQADDICLVCFSKT
jgi:serine phosphatase RsbU (regulator of sigma subunit)/pSer/pThr/pTyr-binding forkhead associated (FHA) protein